MAFDLMDVFVKIGADTSQLDSGLSSASSKVKDFAGGIGSGVGNAIGTGVKMVGTAITAATAAATGFAAASVKVGMDFDSSMSQVAATMGVTTDEIGELRDFAMEMGSSTAFSATQAAEALNYMALAGYDAETSMEMMPNVLNLAAAGNMELARASDMVTDAQTALGLSIGETTELVDMMAKTSSKSNTSVEQLGDAILTVGGTAKTLAGGTNELNTVLGILADNSIKGSEGGTKLRNMILSLSSPTDKAQKLINELGITTKDAAGDLLPLQDIMGQLGDSLDGLGTAERAEIISELFNKTDISAVNALIDTSADRWNELSLEIDGAWMSEKSFQDEMKGAGLENAAKKLQKLGISQADFTKAAKMSKGHANEFLQSLKEISGVDTNVILSEMGTNLNDLQRAFDNVSGSAEQMAQTQLDNLAGDITMFKSALEGAQLLISGELSTGLRDFVKLGTDGLQKMSEGFKAGGLQGAMDAFKGVLSDGLKMVVEKIPDFVDAGIQILGALGQGIIDNAPTIWDAVVEIGEELSTKFLDVLNSMADGLEEVDWAQMAQNIVDFLTDALTSDTAQGILDAGIRIATGLAEGFFEAAPVFLDAGTQALTNLAQGINDFDIKGTAQTVMDNFISYIESDSLSNFVTAGINVVTALGSAIIEAAPIMADGALELITFLSEGLADNVSSLLETAITLVTDFSGYLSENAGKIGEAGVDLVVALGEGIISAVPTILADIPTIISNIVEAIRSLKSSLAQCGTELIGELIIGVVEAAPELIAHFPEILQSIVDVFTLFDPISLGVDIINGIKQGVDDKAPDFVDRLRTAAEDGLEKIKNAEWVQAGIETINKIVEGVTQVASNVWNKFREIMDDVIEKVKNIDWANLGMNIINGIISGLENAASSLYDKVTGIINNALHRGEDTAEVKSPSRLFKRELGKPIALGIAAGIKEGEADVTEAMDDVINAIDTPDITSVFSGDESLTKSLGASADSEEEKMSNLADAIVDAFLRANIAVEMDDREFGRLIRKVGYT